MAFFDKFFLTSGLIAFGSGIAIGTEGGWFSGLAIIVGAMAITTNLKGAME